MRRGEEEDCFALAGCLLRTSFELQILVQAACWAVKSQLQPRASELTHKQRHSTEDGEALFHGERVGGCKQKRVSLIHSLRA